MSAFIVKDGWMWLMFWSGETLLNANKSYLDGRAEEFAHLGVINKSVHSIYLEMQMFTSSAAHRGSETPSRPPIIFTIASFLSNVSSLLISLLTEESQLSQGSLFWASHPGMISYLQLEVMPTAMVSIMKSFAPGNVIIARMLPP